MSITSKIEDLSMLIVELHRGQAGFAQVLPLRRLVFVEQEGYLNAASPLLEDEYDWAQNTFHILVRRDGELAGAVRFTLDLGAGTAADKHFDFRPYLPLEAIIAAGGQLCIDRRHRGVHGVYARMMSCFYLWLTSHGVTHVKGVINPVIAHLFKSAGYRFLGQPFQSHHSNLPCIAVLLDMSDLPITCREFNARHAQRREEESGFRVFMAENENMKPADYPCLHSLFVVSGYADVSTANGSIAAVADGAYLHLSPHESAIDAAWRVRATTDFEAVGFMRELLPS
jgi:N-acyl-L-homoserine lactone synthetase